MRDQNGNDRKIVRFAGPQDRRIDPETARTLARHARQMAMFRFVRDVVVGGLKAIARWHRRNVLYRELAALPDHLLADIGLERGQIADVVYRAGAPGAEREKPAAGKPGLRPDEPERPLAA